MPIKSQTPQQEAQSLLKFQFESEALMDSLFRFSWEPTGVEFNVEYAGKDDASKQQHQVRIPLPSMVGQAGMWAVGSASWLGKQAISTTSWAVDNGKKVVERVPWFSKMSAEKQQ